MPDQYKTIKAAIAKAGSGDTVFVKAGTYDGGFRLTDGVYVVGEGMDKVFIRQDLAVSQHIILGKNCRSGGISNMTIEHYGKTDKERIPSCMSLENNSLEIMSCRILNSGDNGIMFWKGDRSVVSDCIIESNGKNG
ncbi:MAG: right-handed parallel beta-helix repeat-containing protein, partial [Planctomycetota bacterium]